MAYIVRLPKLGMEMQEGTILEWFVSEGDTLAEGDEIAEFESEKSVSTIEAREPGILRRTFLEEGDTVPPGTPVAIVAAESEDIADLVREVEADEEHSSTTDDDPAPAQSTDRAGSDYSAGGGQSVTPRAKKRASELDVDVATIDGTGYEGAVTAEDVEAAADAGTSTAAASLTVREDRTFGRMRQTIADRMQTSYREAVHVTVHREADAEPLAAATHAASEALDQPVSIGDLLVAAVSATLDTHPAFNGLVEDGVHRLVEEHNIGIAVDVEDGLVSPVLPAVDEMGLPEVASTRRALVDTVMNGDFDPDLLANGTFTISNLGPFGVTSFTPIINPPQTAILGVDAITTRTVERDGEVAVRDQIGFDLTFDHRAVDGADAARFLETLVAYIEDPTPLLPEGVSADRQDTPRLPERTVSATTDGGLGGRVSLGSFEWDVDEPVDVGGGATAPTPVDHFLGSLASCLAVSIGFQAKKRELSLSGVTVDVSGTPEDGPLEAIDATVTIGSDADRETVQGLVERAERTCFVSDVLRDDLPLSVSLRD